MESEYNYTTYEFDIDGQYVYVTYNLPKDRMTITPLSDTEEIPDGITEKTIVAEGFEDFCKDNGHLMMGSRSWSEELDGYDETEWEISLGNLIADWDVEPAIKDFITTNYKEQLTLNQ